MSSSPKHPHTEDQSTVAADPDTYRLLVQEFGDGIVSFDRDLIVRVWNRSMSRLTGLAASDCVGQPAVELFARLTLPNAAEALAGTLRGESGLSRTFECRVAGINETRFLEAGFHPVRDAGGRVTAGMVVVRGARPRENPSQAIIDSEQRYRLRFMRSGDAVLVFDRRGRYIDANPAACALTGYSREELLEMSVPSLSIPEERAEAKERFGELLAAGVSCRERLIQRKDGCRIHVEAHAIDLGDGTYQTSIREISERKIAEEQLHQALQRLRFQIERLPLGYLVWSMDFRIVEWNPACAKIFGWEADEILGESWTRLVPEQDRPGVEEIISKLQVGDMSSHSINQNVCKDGTIITCEWFNTSLMDSGGTVTGAASMVHDITERELAESQLRHAQKLESLGVLTRGIAHDFGNLLMVVQGNLTLLKNVKGMPERANDCLTLIGEAAAKASDLTNHLLAFARTGRHKPEPCDLNDIVQAALKLVRGIIPPGIEIRTRLDDSIPRIEIDRSQTEQIILNLCINAAQAMPDGGSITMETSTTPLLAIDVPRCVPHDYPKPGPRVRLAVTDTGRGIDESMVHRIYDPFFTTKPEGHGLGLPAVVGILKQHGAHCVMRSTPGKGTTFEVYFPLRVHEVGDSDAHKKRSAEGGRGQKTSAENQRKKTAASPRTSKRKVAGTQKKRKTKRVRR